MADELDELEDGETLDLNGSGFGTTDWIIDLQGKHSLLNFLTYEITVLHDIDGELHSLETVPDLADEKAGSNLWVLMTSGLFHRIKLAATDYSVDAAHGNEPHGQQYAIRFAECTMVYQGQLA